jgi:hypothetical protein
MLRSKQCFLCMVFVSCCSASSLYSMQANLLSRLLNMTTLRSCASSLASPLVGAIKNSVSCLKAKPERIGLIISWAALGPLFYMCWKKIQGLKLHKRLRTDREESYLEYIHYLERIRDESLGREKGLMLKLEFAERQLRDVQTGMLKPDRLKLNAFVWQEPLPNLEPSYVQVYEYDGVTRSASAPII